MVAFSSKILPNYTANTTVLYKAIAWILSHHDAHVFREDSNMKIGCPKEIKPQEFRVGA
jgi:hypothetical protein